PAVVAQLRMKLGGQGTFVAGGDVGFDVFAFTHPRDGGVHIGIVQDEAESHFSHGHAIGQNRLESIGSRDTGFEILGNEISAAPIAFGPRTLKRQCAGKRALVERYAGDDGDILFAARGKEFVLGILIENVVNDLNGVNPAGTDRSEEHTSELQSLAYLVCRLL